MTSIRVGFEVPTAREVRIEPHHVGVTGLTQRSGKTTLLEALMDRANETAIAFRTSRGEIGFRGAKRIEPYFRPRTDWRFVEGLISAHLMEKAKFYRADLMRLTRGTKNLADVHANVKAGLAKARPGTFPEKILTELNEYMSEIREALEEVHFAPEPNLTPMALSVMDLEGLKPAIQQLVIAATVDWLMEGHLTVPVVTVLPEARDFIPEDRRTPAKLALEDLIRKGARVQRYLWLDSQALTGLDMDVCRSIGTWFFGRQTLDIECRRVARMIPGKRVRPDDVQSLGLGQFYMVQGQDVIRVYVQPGWMNEDSARRVARGEARAEQVDTQARRELDMETEERKEYEDRIKELERQLHNANAGQNALKKALEDLEEKVRHLEDSRKNLLDRVEQEHDRAERNAKAAAANATRVVQSAPQMRTVLDTPDGASASLPTVAASGAIPATRPEDLPPIARERIDLRVDRETPTLTVTTKIVTVEAGQDTPRGKIALLIADDFFEKPKTQAEVAAELKVRGWGDYKGGNSRVVLWRNLQEITGFGFFRYDGSNYELVPEAKERIRVIKERVAA